MDIGFYIADLLSRKDEVSLPGLGTFRKVRVRGSYDEMSNSFLPPAHKVSFDHTPENNNVLAEYISSRKNLSISSAEYFVKKFVLSAFEHLKTTGIAEIKPLGLLSNQQEQISFEISPDFEISGKFYGLRAVSEIENRHAPEAEIFTRDQLSNEESLLEEPKEEELAEEEISGNSTVKWTVISVLILAVIAAGLLYTFNPQVKNYIEGMLSRQAAPAVQAVPPSEKNTFAAADSLDSAADSLSVAAADSATAVPVETTASEVASYEIIGGSFGKISEAETYIEYLRKKGITAKIASNVPGNLIKVSLGSFDDEEAAQTELNRIHRELNKDAWIFRPKSKKTN